MHQLRFISGDMRGQVLDLPEVRITFGRGADNVICTDNPAVSTHHAVIFPEAGGFVVHDLNSRNGTFVNGELIQERRLLHGDVICIGILEMRYELAGTLATERVAVVEPPQPAPFVPPASPVEPRPVVSSPPPPPIKPVAAPVAVVPKVVEAPVAKAPIVEPPKPVAPPPIKPIPVPPVSKPVSVPTVVAPVEPKAEKEIPREIPAPAQPPVKPIPPTAPGKPPVIPKGVVPKTVEKVVPKEPIVQPVKPVEPPPVKPSPTPPVSNPAPVPIVVAPAEPKAEKEIPREIPALSPPVKPAPTPPAAPKPAPPAASPPAPIKPVVVPVAIIPKVDAPIVEQPKPVPVVPAPVPPVSKPAATPIVIPPAEPKPEKKISSESLAPQSEPTPPVPVATKPPVVSTPTVPIEPAKPVVPPAPVVTPPVSKPAAAPIVVTPAEPKPAPTTSVPAATRPSIVSTPVVPAEPKKSVEPSPVVPSVVAPPIIETKAAPKIEVRPEVPPPIISPKPVQEKPATPVPPPAPPVSKPAVAPIVTAPAEQKPEKKILADTPAPPPAPTPPAPVATKPPVVSTPTIPIEPAKPVVPPAPAPVPVTPAIKPPVLIPVAPAPAESKSGKEIPREIPVASPAPRVMTLDLIPEPAAEKAPPAKETLTSRPPPPLTIVMTEIVRDRPRDVNHRFELGQPFTAEEFVQVAREFVSRKENPVQFAPFKSSWPVYFSMSPAQQRWYFYWRDRVRNELYPETDIAYVFFHAYELINNIGVRNVADGYRQLHTLWLRYRGRHPKLDQYLVDWLADYAIVNQQPVDVTGIYDQALALGNFAGEPDLVFPKLMIGSPRPLPLNFIASLADYAIHDSKFYLGGHQRLMDEIIPEALHAVNSQMRKTGGVGIFEKFKPAAPQPIRRRPFQGAPFVGRRDELTIATVFRYSQSPELREFLTGVLKYSENCLRQMANHGGLLRGYDLPVETKSVIEKFLQSSAGFLLQKSKSTLNLSRTEHRFTARDGVRKTLARCTVSELRLLGFLARNPSPVSETVLAAEISTKPLPTAIQHINALALKFIGDVLLVREEAKWLVADDCRAELEFFLMERTGSPVKGVPDGWQDFLRQVSAVQRRVLAAIVAKGAGLDRTLKLAGENQTTPEALIDSINDLARKTIGDDLMDTTAMTPLIEAADVEILSQLLGAQP